MSESLHCTTFDQQLQEQLQHFKNYPQYLPFIGRAWQDQKEKILFIAESHYLPKNSNGKSNSESWYHNTSERLSDEERTWIDTRGVVKHAGHILFNNIKKAVFEAKQMDLNNDQLFERLGFYNYFQRPAEETGKSIQTSEIDCQVAYETLKAIASIIKPTVYIFVSKKAFNNFGYWRVKENDVVFQNVRLFVVAHPTSAWWNKPYKAGSSLRISGKERFIQIIKATDFQIPDAIQT